MRSTSTYRWFRRNLAKKKKVIWRQLPQLKRNPRSDQLVRMIKED
jgi:hypothetical protein